MATRTGRLDIYRRWAAFLAGAVATVAAVVLVLGWGFGVDRLTNLFHGLAKMVPSTALSFILLGGALSIWALDRARPPHLLRTAAIFVGLGASANLVAMVTHGATGIDALLLPFLHERLEGAAMSVATAVSFLLASACALLLTFPPESRLRGLFAPLASLGLLLPLISLAGHLFDTAALLSVYMFGAMALHTATLLFALFIALMLLSERGWIWLLLGEGIGSTGARRLFPTVVVAPFVICLLALLATRAGKLDPNFRVTLLAIIMMVVGLIAILRNAQVENRSERRLGTLLADLEQAVADKNLLIREIHHRVKNNLQQITALIAIEASKFKDPQAREPFDALGGRIQALGLVQQLLMQSSRPSDIGIAGFLHDLCNSIQRSHYLIKRNIQLTVDARDDEVQMDSAITIGLLVNELIVNAIKHAFNDRGRGRIFVTYGADPDNRANMRLIVSDNGCGIDLQAAVHEMAGGGTRIIRSLVTQLRGKMDMDISNGTTVSISFPASIYEEHRYAAE